MRVQAFYLEEVLVTVFADPLPTVRFAELPNPRPLSLMRSLRSQGRGALTRTCQIDFNRFFLEEQNELYDVLALQIKGGETDRMFDITRSILVWAPLPCERSERIRDRGRGLGLRRDRPRIVEAY